MKKLTVSDPEAVILALQDEIRRTHESRYDHRLHALLLVAQGMSCGEVSRLLGDASRTVQYWVRRFEAKGLLGLVEEEKPGRPPRLTEKQLDHISSVLGRTPCEAGISATIWDGKILSAFIKQKWGIDLGMRQCQRLFRQLGFRFRKPRPVIAHANPDRQASFKNAT